VDTLITLSIVASAAGWAAFRLWRRANAKPAACAGSCSGCPMSPGGSLSASRCSRSDGAPAAFVAASTGIPLPSREDGRP
jgi:hypothetical protein